MPSRFTILWQHAKDKVLKVNSKDVVHQRKSGTGKEEAQIPPSVADPSVVSSPKPCMFTWVSRPAKKLMVCGFETQILSLNKLLGERENNTQFKAVGVVGVRGVGKTALCQMCFYQDDDSFSPKVWVKVAKLTKTEVLRGVLERLRVKEMTISSSKNYHGESEKIKALTYLLRCQLIGKRYLIVLDGVSSHDPWYDDLSEIVPIRSTLRLASGLPKKSLGTVIVTSRNEKAVAKMVKEGHRDMHRVDPLSDPKSISMIFQDAICKLSSERHGGGEVDMKEVVERVEKTTITKRQLLGEEIKTEQTIMEMVVKKSNGLPLTAMLMAETMLDQLEEREKIKSAQRDAAKKNGKASYDGEVDRKVAEEDRVGEKLSEKRKGSESGEVLQKREEEDSGKSKEEEKEYHRGNNEQGQQEEVVNDEKASRLKKRDGLKEKETSNDQVIQRKEEVKQKEECGDDDGDGEGKEKEEDEHKESTKKIGKMKTQSKEKEEKKDEDENEDKKEVGKQLNEEKEKEEEKHKKVIKENSIKVKEEGESEHTEATKKIKKNSPQGKDGEQEHKEATNEVRKKSVQDKEKEDKEEQKIATKELGEKSTSHGKEGEEALKNPTHGREEKEATKDVGEKSARHNKEANVDE